MNQNVTRPKRGPVRIAAVIYLALCGILVLSACAGNMRDDGRIKPYEPVSGFKDGVSEQPLVQGVVARSQTTDLALETGKENGDGALLNSFPIKVTTDVIARGKDRYGIYCAPCHGAAGDGKGVIMSFGFQTKAPTYYSDTLKLQPVGHFFDVSSNGKGVMYGYASRISVEDRWAIVAYIRAMQINKDAPLEVTPEQVEQSGGSVK